MVRQHLEKEKGDKIMWMEELINFELWYSQHEKGNKCEGGC